MASLRNIFSVGSRPANDRQFGIPPSIRTFQQFGVIQAGKVDASSNALQPCLQAIYIEVRRRIAANEVIQEKRKNPIRQKIADLEAKDVNFDSQIKTTKGRLEAEKDDIKRLRNDIARIKANPKEITGDTFARASFWIGTIIIALLTVYLFIFYSSAAYSAFFKNFTVDDTNIVNSIFDAQAIAKAFIDGFTELILILTIPAVFLGLGFLIHKFSEQERASKYFKIAGLVVTTFIFDFIIAYEIVEKIYNIKKQGSFQPMPAMTIAMAAQQINFWLIIFAGFVVYIIWGFVFDFVMVEYQKLDRVNHAIKSKEKEIRKCEVECKELNNKIQQLESQKNTNIGEIEKLKIELRGVIIFIQEIKQGLGDFFTGWLSYMENAGKNQIQIDECTNIFDKFLVNIPIQNTHKYDEKNNSI
jgi:hypothetical protein